MHTEDRTLWRSLYYFNLYRLVIGVAFFAIGFSGGEFATLGSRYPSLFILSSFSVITIATISLYTITRARPNFRLQAFFQFGSDVILIALLSSASGGIASGLYLLLLVSVAASGIVLPGRVCFFFAALGAVLALADYWITYLKYHPSVTGSSTQVGILGIALFSTSLIINLIVSRTKKAEDRARRSESDLIRVSRLNELVVANLDTGIIVTDRHGNIQIANERARTLLDFSGLPTLARVSNALHLRMIQWLNNHEEDSPIQVSAHGPNIAPRFVNVTEGADASIVVFLEDLSETERQAHNLKLASLGRLTSAVAHEIRNPLGAISHAGELIGESADLSSPDRRLVEIISQQSDRINSVIKSILGLSRPHLRNPLPVDLDAWLQNFKTVFMQTHNRGNDCLEFSPTGQHVFVDPDHLHQVVTNLCENGLRYGVSDKVWISGGNLQSDGTSYLDIVNDGPEIPPDLRQKIFEPFFTTESKGTGLGLYLARELCHDNKARLDYVDTPRGCRFRIEFPHSAHVAA